MLTCLLFLLGMFVVSLLDQQKTCSFTKANYSTNGLYQSYSVWSGWQPPASLVKSTMACHRSPFKEQDQYLNFAIWSGRLRGIHVAWNRSRIIGLFNQLESNRRSQRKPLQLSCNGACVCVCLFNKSGCGKQTSKQALLLHMFVYWRLQLEGQSCHLLFMHKLPLHLVERCPHQIVRYVLQSTDLQAIWKP